MHRAANLLHVKLILALKKNVNSKGIYNIHVTIFTLMSHADTKRFNRLTAILVQLQSKRIVKASDIAERFQVSLRTVYRDIKALEQAGIPLYGEPSKGYSIMEGYRIPPVMFTEEEALSLITAEKIMDRFTDNTSAQQYKAAMYKIRAVLRYKEKERIEAIEDSIQVLSIHDTPHTGNELHLQHLLKSIADKQVIEIGYTKVDSTTYSNRLLEPIGIYYLGNHWYLVAYCKLRHDYRTFRTDRISYLNITSEGYHSMHPRLENFINKLKNEKDLEKVVIEVQTSVLKYLGNQKYYLGFVNQEIKGEITRMTYLTGSLEGFARYFLMFGDQATIIEPETLKDTIKKMLINIEKKLKS